MSRGPRRARRAVRATAALLLTAVAVLLAPLLPGPTDLPLAYADEPVASVSIALTSLSPALPRRDGSVTVAGTVTNITKERLVRLQAIFWRNQAPITDDDGMAAALASASNDPIGARKTTVLDDLYTDANPYLDPGESARFRLTAKVADLELSPTDGVYLMGVHVLQNGVNLAVGRARTFVPVITAEPEHALAMTSVVVLSSRPAQVRDRVFADDHLAAEVAAGGRLSKLLAAADRAAVSFAVDPELVQELTAMKAGYEVLSTDDRTVAGTGSAAAGRWLQKFGTVAGHRDGFRLLYGSPDIAALVHSGQRSALQAVVTSGRAVTATSELPLLVLPAGGAADKATLSAARGLDPKAVLLSDTTASGAGPLLADGAGTPIVSYTATTRSSGGPGPDPQDTVVQVRQRTLADTWLQASTGPEHLTQGRVRLITKPAQTAPDDAAASAPWLERGNLSALLNGSAARWDGKLRYSEHARSQELSAGQLAGLKRFTASSAAYADLLVDSTAARTAGTTAVARAASAAWRGQDSAQHRFLVAQQATLDDILQTKIVISSSPKVSTVARDGVVFPITIRNLLDAPGPGADPNTNAVRLQLRFESDNAARLTIKPITTTEPLRAQQSYTANAEVRARANGVVPVRAQLYTLSGKPVGKPFLIDVRVTQNGTTGWVIAVAAGLVLVGSTTWRIRRVAKERAAAADDEVPVSALTSAPPTDPSSHADPSEEFGG